LSERQTPRAGGLFRPERGNRIDMPKTTQPDIKPAGGLTVAIGTALAVKVVALAAIYFAFFVPAPHPTPHADRAAVLGLPSPR
jgi:hypothetical protein